MYPKPNEKPLRELQQLIQAAARKESTKPIELVQLSQAYVSIEAFKRELRGFPRLDSVSIRDLKAIRAEARKAMRPVSILIEDSPLADPSPPAQPPSPHDGGVPFIKPNLTDNTKNPDPSNTGSLSSAGFDEAQAAYSRSKRLAVEEEVSG